MDGVTVGPHTYCGSNCEFRPFEGHVIIGDYCSIADQVMFIAGGEHLMGRVSTFPFLVKFGIGSFPSMSRGDVVVGSDVWIGTRAIFLPGVSVGHGAVIGAGAVVTRDVPPYAVAAGNPARVVRYRFDEETIARLLACAWWEWPEEKVREYVPLMDDPLTFLEAVGC